MSHIGQSKILIPSKVDVSLLDIKPGYTILRAVSELGEKKIILNNLVNLSLSDNVITLSIKEQTKYHKTLWGLYRTLINNTLCGLFKKYTIKLNISGVGYRYQLIGNKLLLKVGYSHDIDYTISPSVSAKAISSSILELSGIDKQEVHQVASIIRSFKKPDSYKGKGIRYHKEKITLKQGKRG